MKKNKKFAILGIMGSLALALAFIAVPVAEAYTIINSSTSLRVGSRGEAVRAMQELIASDLVIYPSGSQDGVFGSKTKEGVIQFQLAHNLTADGIAGPVTRSRMNAVVATGRGIDVSSPRIFGLSVTSSGRNEMFAFTSNEPVKTAVFYDTSAINWDSWNDKVASLETPTISGLRSVDDSFSLSKQLTLAGLSANTRYDYTVTATDQSGNTSVILP